MFERKFHLKTPADVGKCEEKKTMPVCQTLKNRLGCYHIFYEDK